MDQTLRLGRIHGIELGVNWSVLVIFGLLTWSLAAATLPSLAEGYPVPLYWALGLAGAFLLVCSILAHELSHAVVAERHGVRVEGITLWMFGGVSLLGSRAPDAGTELRIALAGPLSSFAIAAGSGALAVVAFGVGAPRLIVAALGWLGLMNLMLAAFNLLPGAPLDGGRVLAAVLWHRSGDEAGSRLRAATAGRLVGQVLIALGIVELVLGAGVGGVWLAFLGWFLTSAARAEEAVDSVDAALAGLRVGDVMSRGVQTVDARWTVGELVHGHSAHHASSFPVIDASGRLVGLVTLRQLRQLPVESWSETTLGSVAVALDRLAIAREDEALIDVLRRQREGAMRVLVMEGERLVGIVTPSDVTRAVKRAAAPSRRDGVRWPG